MRHEEGDLEGVGGLRLYRQAWLPDGFVKAAVVLIHGGAEHSSRYGWVAEQLTARGYALHALDLPGHGRSEGQRAYIDRFADAVEDVDRLADLAAAQHPGVPLYVLGHSMGGCIALLYAIAHQDRLAGLVLSAPLAAIDGAPLPLRLIGRALSVVAPKAGVIQVDATGVSNDPAVVEAYENDPLVFRGKLPARTVAEIADAVASFPEGVCAITIPLLVMASPDDTIVEYAGSELVHGNCGSEDKTFITYEGLAHEILNEPERQRVLDDIAAWLDART